MAGKKPDYEVFVSEENNGKSYYTKIGAAWKVAKDGISIVLQFTPIGHGKMVMFPREDEVAE